MKNSCAVIIISVICNIFLCVIKTIIGIFSNSQALIADGLHSLEDVSSSVISLIGDKISSKENKNYSFGIKRVKYVFSLTVSVLMVMIAITMLKNVISSLFEPSKYIFNIYSLVICLITIVIKLILYIYSRSEYIKTNNILIKSIMYDHRNDIIITIGVVISIIVTRFDLYVLDYIVGVIISLIIGVTGTKIYLESYEALMCKNINYEQFNKHFCNNIAIVNMGDENIGIINGRILENNDFGKIYSEELLEEYNISQLFIRYM